MALADQDIIGRNGANNIDAIMEIAEANTDVDEVIHVVKDNSDAIFTWDYDKGKRAKLDKLYEKAKTSQWNVTTDLDWSIEVDPYTALDLDLERALMGDMGEDPSSPIAKWDDKEWEEFGLQSIKWRLSQFLHGEQGALLCTPRSSRPCRGSTPSSTPPPRRSMRPVTSRSSVVTSTRNSVVDTR